MKKYVKPELIYERYELAQHIAACAFDLHNMGEGSCGFKGEDSLGLGDLIILNDSIAACDIKDYEGYCYHAGPDGMNTHNS